MPNLSICIPREVDCPCHLNTTIHETTLAIESTHLNHQMDIITVLRHMVHHMVAILCHRLLFLMTHIDLLRPLTPILDLPMLIILLILHHDR